MSTHDEAGAATMPGFMKRKLMESLATRIGRVYFTEVDRLNAILGKPTNAAEVFRVHDAAWGRVQGEVLRGTGFETFGVQGAQEIEALHQVALAKACGVSVEQLDAHWNSQELANAMHDLRQARQLLEAAASEADRVRLINGYRPLLNYVKPGVDEEWDSERKRFLRDYGYLLEQ